MSDGEKTYIIRNGLSIMSRITGSGCMLSAMTAAYITANPNYVLEAAAASFCAMGLAGEIAEKTDEAGGWEQQFPELSH